MHEKLAPELLTTPKNYENYDLLISMGNTRQSVLQVRSNAARVEPKSEFEPKSGFELKSGFETKSGFESKSGFEPKSGFDPEFGFDPKPGFVPEVGFDPSSSLSPSSSLIPSPSLGLSPGLSQCPVLKPSPASEFDTGTQSYREPGYSSSASIQIFGSGIISQICLYLYLL